MRKRVVPVLIALLSACMPGDDYRVSGVYPCQSNDECLTGYQCVPTADGNRCVAEEDLSGDAFDTSGDTGVQEDTGPEADTAVVVDVTDVGDAAPDTVEPPDTGVDTEEVADSEEVADTEEDAVDTADTGDTEPVEDQADVAEGWCAEPRGFGCSCDYPTQCNSGHCVPHPEGLVCSRTCEADCPEGFVCQPQGEEPGVCIYPFAHLCKPCNDDAECTYALDESPRCLQLGAEGNFCGYGCTTAGDCPQGYTCQAATTVGGESASFCVPAGGECPCTPYFVEEGFVTSCQVVNEWGACAGERQCGDDGEGNLALTPCDGPEPKAETCNRTDDDCDGETDDNITTIPDDVCPSEGVCSAGVVTECINGYWKCDYSGLSDYEANRELTCDGLDNDCDSETDEDFSVELLDGTTVNGVGADCGTGGCAGGLTVCLVDGTGIECPSESKVAAEGCDGLDNDCDGLTDEVADLVTTPCENQSGVCEGAQHLASLCVDGGFSPCTAAAYRAHNSSYQETESSCDGLDNDCDSGTDDTFSLTLLDGRTVTGVGRSCGTGVCAGGTTQCSGSGIVCPTESEASSEECDGVDNDCNGSSDEGCDDDNDDHCDSSMKVAYTDGDPPSVCNQSEDPGNGRGDDCDDDDDTVPSCTDKECGDDGCGGSCGDCGAGEACVANTCVPVVPSAYTLRHLMSTSIPHEPMSDPTYTLQGLISTQQPFGTCTDGTYTIRSYRH